MCFEFAREDVRARVRNLVHFRARIQSCRRQIVTTVLDCVNAASAASTASTLRRPTSSSTCADEFIVVFFSWFRPLETNRSFGVFDATCVQDCFREHMSVYSSFLILCSAERCMRCNVWLKGPRDKWCATQFLMRDIIRQALDIIACPR